MASASTRDDIRSAASRLFRERGFARTTVREIAAQAGVDPALVIRHFGTKELLFLETMRLSMNDEPLLDVPPERLGERFVEVLLDGDEPSREIFLALVRGSGEPRIAARLKETHEKAFVEPLRARLTGPDAETRARMAGALVAGLLYSLWVAGDERLLAADRSELVTRYGALVQQVLTPGE
ncbi:TetR family transcriptional regulator [Nocardiopsis algeriensis]|uniref:AcrR family transcriptional regulator n=1 Tax=Nocardiopsis algeriensis TaxID=1478215 RepID=A0A841IHJ1_9ACTN|nr:TetR family transcriptional regulator [Nocardiopsis algeriensis]MBB6118247.1 AcrR family transcriptional regulator [Nocardiopsis algeriensis]